MAAHIDSNQMTSGFFAVSLCNFMECWQNDRNAVPFFSSHISISYMYMCSYFNSNFILFSFTNREKRTVAESKSCTFWCFQKNVLKSISIRLVGAAMQYIFTDLRNSHPNLDNYKSISPSLSLSVSRYLSKPHTHTPSFIRKMLNAFAKW